MKITLESPCFRDSYVEYVHSAYDLDLEEKNRVEVPMNFNLDSLKDWNIGLIVGASGSGKSVILNHLGGGMTAKFDNNKSVISNFETMSPEEAAKVLCAVGLSSVPTWVRPFNVLSNGEKYRAELAWLLAHEKGIIRVDEYTSVVNRVVAKSMSCALRKYIKANNKQIILAACHYDIIEWLQPDWIYDLNKGGVLERGDYLQRPTIPLRLYRVEPSAWRIFKKHHYMSQDLNEAAACYVAEWEDNPVAFSAILPLPNGMVKDGFRASRIVVLPDYQGVGIGSTLTDTLAGIYKSKGLTLYTKTVNPALGLHQEHSPLWEATAKNNKYIESHNSFVDNNGRRYLARKSYCHKYIGPAIYGYEDLIKPIDQMRRDRSLEGQLSLF